MRYRYLVFIKIYAVVTIYIFARTIVSHAKSIKHDAKDGSTVSGYKFGKVLIKCFGKKASTATSFIAHKKLIEAVDLNP